MGKYLRDGKVNLYAYRIAKISCTLPVKKFNDVVFLKYFDCEDAFATIYVTLIMHGTVKLFYSSIELLVSKYYFKYIL